MSSKSAGSQQERYKKRILKFIRYLKYIDRWIDRPAANREMDASTYNRPQSSNKEENLKQRTIVLLKKYASSSSVEAAISLSDNSPFSSYERVHLLDESYSKKGYQEKALSRLHGEEYVDQESKGEESVDQESSRWHAGEDSSDFEIVERS